jgi:hypothetical protein
MNTFEAALAHFTFRRLALRRCFPALTRCAIECNSLDIFVYKSSCKAFVEREIVFMGIELLCCEMAVVDPSNSVQLALTKFHAAI